MKNKAFWSIFCLNIAIIIVFLFFLLDNKNNKIPVSTNINNNLQQQIIDWADKISNIVVEVTAEDKNMIYQDLIFDENSLLEKKSIQKKWSAIIASNKWYIITNSHVVDDINLKYSIITKDWKSYPVKNIRKDNVIDLAILFVEFENKNILEAKFIDIDSIVNIWQFVFAVWNPFSEYPSTVSLGIISWKWRKIDVDNLKNTYYAWLYQTDTALSPGNSWWPLVNLSWEIIGMITAISRWWSNIWFALPLNNLFIENTIDVLEKNNKLLRPYIGISYKDSENWAIVDTIFSWSPVQWQILVEDIILNIDNRKVSIERPLLYYLYSYKPWDTIILNILRKNQKLSISVVLWQQKL